MKDLTQGSITRHILSMAAPVALSAVTQTAYQLVSLYYVAGLGAAATAGVNAAANVVFVVAALTQVLGVGTVGRIAHAIGRKDREEANAIFNQALSLSVGASIAMALVLYASMLPYLRLVAADESTIVAGWIYIAWALPGHALALPMAVYSAALRAAGVVLPTVCIYGITVIVNTILAPILITGWGTGMALGVVGAGVATTCSATLGIILFAVYFHRADVYLSVRTTMMRPQSKYWRDLLKLGVPAGSDFVFTFLGTAVTYYAISAFGVAAQAGFSIGLRVLQTAAIPGLSIAFAAGPIAGQSFGARKGDRVLETFRRAVLLGVVIMAAITLVLRSQIVFLVEFFKADAAAAGVAAVYLSLMSWTLAAQALVYTCKTMFQGLGSTVPAFVSSMVCFIAFSVSALWVSRLPGFDVEEIWNLSIASVVLQAILSLFLLRREFVKRLGPGVLA